MENGIVKFNAPELNLIEASKAEQIRNTFEPMAEMLKEFEDLYNEIAKESEGGITKELTAKAKRLRLDIAKVRIETEKIRKDQKEEYLRAGKAIDGVSNILKWAVTEKENKLKDIENHFELLEKQRIADLQDKRVKKLSKYVDDANERNLGEMDDDVWNAYFSAKKQAWEDEQEAIKKAEEERKKQELKDVKRKERADILFKLGLSGYLPEDKKDIDFGELEEAEFLKIKEEASKSKKVFLDEQERIRKENEKLIKQREADEAKKKKEQKAYEEKIKKEREENERLQKQLKDQQEAQEKARKEAEAKEQAELSKGDSDKVNDLINDLQALKTKYSFKSAKNKKMYSEVSELLDKIVTHIKK